MAEGPNTLPDLKKISFTLITIFVVPLLFFVALELGLAAFGVGNSYDFFRKTDIDGQTYFQENPDFADQFYPASLDIKPRRTTFAVDRSPDSVRVLILGGSAALGFPHKNHGIDRLLQTQLTAALPSKEIEVINTAMTSVNSHVVYAVANSIPKDSADFAVILMGNNEVVGPYGPGTLNDSFVGNVGLIRAIQALKRTRIWQALDALLLKVRPDDALQELEWQGMQMFTNRGVAHDDPRMLRVYDNYAANLSSIIDTLQDKGMHVILSSVPVNLRDSAPFLSLHDPDLSTQRLDEWRELTRHGARSADEQNWSDAAARFEAALEINPAYADTHFRLARVLEKLGDRQRAETHYRHALDYDALRFRADTAINQIVQDTAAAAEGQAFSFVDSASAFEGASRPHLPGWNLLLEHVHYDFSGNHLLAAGIARSVVGELTGASDFEPLSASEVANRVGFPNYDTYSEIQTLQAMIEQPPFPGQSNYVELETFLEGKLRRLAQVIGSPEDVIRKRRDVVASGHADWKIHFELAVLNERQGNSTAMYHHLNKILELYPHNRETYLKIAEAKSKEGKWTEAISMLQRSLDYTRGSAADIADTLTWLGVAHLRAGQFADATSLLLQVTEDYPGQPTSVLRAYGNLVRLAREQGRRKELERYIRDVQRYARSFQRKGSEEDVAMLNQRVAQILSLGGYAEEAKEWAQAGQQ